MLVILITILFTMVLSLPLVITPPGAEPQKTTQAVIRLAPMKQQDAEPEAIQEEEVSEEPMITETVIQEVPRKESTSFPEVPLPQRAKPSEKQALEKIFYGVDEVTTPPAFDRTLVINQIQYPSGAKRRGLEAQVLLRLYINASGVIDDIVILEDPGYGFGEAAVQAFDHVTFTPARVGSLPVAVTIVFPVQFQLNHE
jgi:TonB family protein